ncbi:MAG: hypothetical protein PSV22_14340 [Pseudolabrys sp.]|nr:hypothetical protein [Pseudolabrys sp.]
MSSVLERVAVVDSPLLLAQLAVAVAVAVLVVCLGASSHCNSYPTRSTSWSHPEARVEPPALVVSHH